MQEIQAEIFLTDHYRDMHSMVNLPLTLKLVKSVGIRTFRTTDISDHILGQF